MFSTLEISKTTYKTLQDVQDNFLDIETIVSGILKTNFTENLDENINKKSKDKKKHKSDKLPDNIAKKLQDVCTNPHTKEYLEPAILPSTKFWTVEEKSEKADKSEVKLYGDMPKSVPFSLAPFANRKFGCEEQTFIKMGTYVFIENTGISGLNQHLQNPNIFFVVSPCNGYLHLITDFSSEGDMLRQMKQYGQRYLADIISHVKQSIHKDTNINCLVLGKRSVQENMDAYDPWFIMDTQDDKQQHIEHYYFPKEDSKAAADVDVYNINAHGHEMSLSSTDLELLHNLAEKTKKQKGAEAIIVHCQQGLDRTGMLIFAFILYQNYDYYFSGKKRSEKIYEAYKTLQLSRSPVALTKAADFVNAVYLANTLKAIDIEKQCSANLDTISFEDKMIDERKHDFLLKMNLTESNNKKIEILESELEALQKLKIQKEYTRHESHKRRPRSSSCNSKEIIPTDTMKKSYSEPDELYSHREKMESMEDKSDHKIKSPRGSGSFFKKPKKSVSLEVKAPELQNQVEHDNKTDVLVTTHSSGSKLFSIMESAEEDSHVIKDNAGGADAKSVNNAITAKPVKHSSGLFSLKPKKRQSDSFKQQDLQNPVNAYMNELIFLSKVIQHRKNTEDALQHRIKPIEEKIVLTNRM